jgi:NTP pyrophosphatase (non-canonical NTP hydrolase)
MRSGGPGPRHPSEVHEDWQKAREAILSVSENARRGHTRALPSWTLHLSLSEIRQLAEEIADETDWHFSLAIMSAIEGLFNLHLRFLVDKKRKDGIAQALRSEFKIKVKKRKRIRFEEILDELMRVDSRAAPTISKLKEMLKFRHWLAHGRHWSIHYRNCPDPNDVYSLFERLEEFVAFESSP